LILTALQAAVPACIRSNAAAAATPCQHGSCSYPVCTTVCCQTVLICFLLTIDSLCSSYSAAQRGQRAVQRAHAELCHHRPAWSHTRAG
jgi:hypothetical protein